MMILHMGTRSEREAFDNCLRLSRAEATLSGLGKQLELPELAHNTSFDDINQRVIPALI